jgi:hypothetical protein
MEIKVSRVRDNDGTPWDSSFVEVDGIKRGIVRPDNSGGWVAEMMGCYKTTDPANVFGWFGTKQRAVDRIAEATANYPKCIVYPSKNEQTARNWQALGIAAR